jgi:hypothetical protein
MKSIVLTMLPGCTVLLTIAITAHGQTPSNSYRIVNLVSNVAGAAAATDPNLSDAWGISNPNSPFWISDHGSGLTTVYAASEVDYHLPAPSARRLREIFRLETERVLGNDWVIRHDNRFYQVEGDSANYAPAKSRVLVCEWEDGSMEIHYRGRKLRAMKLRNGRASRQQCAPPAGRRRLRQGLYRTTRGGGATRTCKRWVHPEAPQARRFR